MMEVTVEISRLFDYITCLKNRNSIVLCCTIGAGAVQTSKRYYEVVISYKLQTMVTRREPS